MSLAFGVLVAGERDRLLKPIQKSCTWFSSLQIFVAAYKVVFSFGWLIIPLISGNHQWRRTNVPRIAGSHDAAQRDAMIYSLFATCRMQNINPYNRLKDVLTRIPDYTTKNLYELLPQN